MKLQLIANIQGVSLGYLFGEGDEVTVGREIGNTIAPLIDSLSRKHARIFFKDGEWMVEDLESTNGSYLNGNKITAPQKLSNGDALRLGMMSVTVELKDDAAAPAAPAAPAPAPAPAPAAPVADLPPVEPLNPASPLTPAAAASAGAALSPVAPVTPTSPTVLSKPVAPAAAKPALGPGLKLPPKPGLGAGIKLPHKPGIKLPPKP